MQENNKVLESREVAEMLGKEHKQVLKDIRRYTIQLNEGEISPVDFWSESSYEDNKGQNRPCYLITKKGCEFLAHKLTGQKGTEFTAKYINRFHEMENQIRQASLTEHPGEVANYLKEMGRRMEKERIAPYKIAEAFKMVSEQYGIQLPNDFVKVPIYEQMTLDIVER